VREIKGKSIKSGRINKASKFSEEEESEKGDASRNRKVENAGNEYINSIGGNTIESKIKDGLERITEIYKTDLIDIGLKFGLSATQVQIIRKLKSAKEFELSKIADMLGIDISTLSKSIKNLEQKNIIIWRKKGQKKILSLTKKGRKIAEESGKVDEIIDTVAKNLGEEDKNTIYSFIYKVIDESLKEGIIRYQRMCSTCVFFSVKKDAGLYCLFLQKKLDIPDLMINCKDYIQKTEIA